MIPNMRAWDKELKKMFYAKVEPCEDGLKYVFEQKLVDKNPTYMWGSSLPDKNGREIFQGDIVRTLYGTGIVKYGDYEFSSCDETECVRHGWYVDVIFNNYVKNTGYELRIYKEKRYGVEVINNIYENPEWNEEQRS